MPIRPAFRPSLGPASPLARLPAVGAVVGTFAALAGPASPAAPCDILFERELAAIPVYDALGPVEQAWRGGWEKARPQLLDIDADGDLDLFVVEDRGRLRFFRNEGDSSAPDFVFVTDDYAGVHERFWARFADVDSDGDWDLLVEAPKFDTVVGGTTIRQTGAYLYSNVGGPADAAWSNLSPHPDGYFTDETGTPIGFENASPDFGDFDGDGDADLLMGDRNGLGYVYLYRNVGTPGAPSFRLEDESYDGMIIAPGLCTTEEPARASGRSGSRHGYMQFVLHDADGDLALDLFVGDQNSSNAYYWRNVGSPPSPSFECQTEWYFPAPSGLPAVFPSYVLPTFGDLDGDGDADALLGSGSSGDLGIHHYRNRGTPTAPDHRQVDDDYLPELDLGRSTVPSFGDLDGDGKLDLLLGVGSAQVVTAWLDVGTASAPELGLLSDNWMPQPGSDWAAPELADLDADGDLDLFVGRSLGAIRAWRNDGTPASPIWQPIEDDPAFGDAGDRLFRLYVPDRATPRFFDGDADGDLDALVGNWNSNPAPTLMYFRNDGSPTAHSFVFASADYQGLGAFGEQAIPGLAFGDLDQDGDDDLVVGTQEGTITYLQNEADGGPPAFVRVTDFFGGIDVGVAAAPALRDLDGDGDLDLVVGEEGGGLNHFRNVSEIPGRPTAFALTAPAADEAIPGNEVFLFDWEPSFDPDTGAEVEYELRIAADPNAPASGWRTFPGLTESSFGMFLWRWGFRFEEEFWWTVAARNGCATGSVPPPRHGVNSTLDPRLEDPPHAKDHPAPPWARPTSFGISAVFPSPSRTETAIRVDLPEAQRLRVVVYDATGRRVATLADGPARAGTVEVLWRGRDDRGRAVGPGVYLVRAEAGGRTATRRVIRLR